MDGAIGAACKGKSDCKQGTCLTEASFAGGYCLAECGDESACPDGATCHDYLGYRWCLDSCEDDEQCRDSYVCEYGVCRPPCANDRVCQGQDTCRKQRCQPPCTKNDECDPGQRCQDGDCLAPCKQDEECLPGFACDATSGACTPKPGKPMGEICNRSQECATGYCLPSRKLCSIQCAGTADCPRDYACGLEKVDQDNNGSLDAALAACVPRAGAGQGGDACAKDEDCGSGHCYGGFCMEGCEKNENCDGGMRCVPVNLLVGGAIPSYTGCLPATGESHNFEVGAANAGELIGVDIPPNAVSFVLSTKVDDPAEAGIVAEATAPDGAVLTAAMGECDFYSQPIRYAPAPEVASLFVPNTTAVQLRPGVHTFRISATKPNMPVKALLSLKLGKATKGTVDITWVFLDLTGHPCIPGGTLNASSAPGHAWFKSLGTSLSKILSGAGLSIGTQAYKDLKDPKLDVLDLSSTGASPELGALFSSSAGISGNSVTVFFVRDIKDTGGAGFTLGLAGGIPGPPALHGTVNSGIAFSTQTACFEQSGYNPGHTLAHEIGHYLGLFHNQENFPNPGWDTQKQEVVCPCPCGANMTCQWDFGAKWCRGLDPLPDTQTSNANLMYFAAENTQDFSGNQISPGQIEVMLRNPIVGH